MSAILITHQHPDHIDVTRLPTLLEDNPAAELYADPQTAAQLGEPWRAVHVGDELPLAELTVRAVGGCHAVIHPEIPVIEKRPQLADILGGPAAGSAAGKYASTQEGALQGPVAMDTAPAEPGDLAGCIQPGQWRTVGLEHPSI